MIKEKVSKELIGIVGVLIIMALFFPSLNLYGNQEQLDEPQRSPSILIIDQSMSFATSLQTELLARKLSEKLSADITARQQIPRKIRQNEAFEIIFIIPRKISQMWVLTGFVPYKTPKETRKVLEGLYKIAKRVYSRSRFPNREVVGIIDDLAPAAWASYLNRYNWLQDKARL